jgi:tetratricopeptide (TPR) repeat protein
MDKRFFAPALFALVLVAFFSLYPAVRNGFVNWDDYKYVVENGAITNLSWANAGRIFSTFYVGAYVPLTALSFAVEFKFFRLDPRAYHVTNLIFHLLNCLLVFLLVDRLRRNRTAAFVAALLFGVHPLHVESVAWITERKDMLYGFFFLAAALAYLGYLNRKKISAYFLALALFALSLLAKPTAAVLPFILLTIDFLLKREFKLRLILEKIPFFMLSGGALFVAVLAQGSTGTFQTGERFNFLSNLYHAANYLLFYLLKIIAPVKLACLYPEPRFWFAPIVVIGLAGLALWSVKRTRVVAFGALFFLVALLPMLQLIPVGQPLADRYTYLALIGPFFVLGVALAQVLQKAGTPVRAALWLAFAAAVAGCAFQSRHQTYVWKDGVALWTNTIDNYPVLPLAYNNRGVAYCYQGDNRRAIPDFNRALRLRPDYPDALNNRGNAWRGLAEFDRAIADYTEAIRYDPHLADVYYNRAVAYFLKKDYAACLGDLKKYEALGFVVPPEFYADLRRAMNE